MYMSGIPYMYMYMYMYVELYLVVIVSAANEPWHRPSIAWLAAILHWRCSLQRRHEVSLAPRRCTNPAAAQ